MKLELTEAALEDLRSIRAYTLETWGPRQEQIYLESLWEKFRQILQHPDRFRQRPDLFPECQLAAEGRHVILFRIQEDVLQVVRVLHSAMDFKRQIGGK